MDIILNEQGEFDAYAWPGGYPIYYICEDGEALCPKCCNENKELIAEAEEYLDRQWQIVGRDINYEDPDLYCAHCCERIESAYAEEDQ